MESSRGHSTRARPIPIPKGGRLTFDVLCFYGFYDDFTRHARADFCRRENPLVLVSNVARYFLSHPAMPRVQEGSFPSEAHGGVRIHTKAWLPDGLGADRLRDKVASPPSAVVLWSHGLHEHLGRFEKLHEALVAKNVAVYAWDHVGHGESGSCGEKRHQFPRGFDAVVADALQFARCERRDKTRGCRKKKTRARLFFSFRRVRQEFFCNSLLASSSSSL